MGRQWWWIAGVLQTLAVAGEVEVVGDRNPANNREFVWTVSNLNGPAITSVRFNHYLGNLPNGPEGWVPGEMTNNIAHGGKDAPGTVAFNAADPKNGIRRGSEGSFSIRMIRKWVGFTQPQTVWVGFADGTEMEIAGVKSPAQEPFLRRNGTPIVFGLILLVVVLVQSRRRRSSPGAGGHGAGTADQ